MGGNFLQQRLSKLYSDTKQSYESAKVVPTASPNVEDDTDVVALRREFSIQQDRLLAWGIHWADVGVQAASSYMKKGQDVNIDEKIDQAGLGDLVASVMQEIKRLLDESGKLQHPERYELSKKPSSPRLQRKEWKDYEVQTGRVLLNQLKGCIDVLYSLVENQKQEPGPITRNKSMSVDEAFGTTTEDTPISRVFAHPLYIDFASLAPMHDPDASAEPPSYDDAQDSTGIKARSIYYYPTAQAHVIVDLVPIRSVPTELDTDSPIQQLYNTSDKLSGGGLMSWDGHLKLLGFTLASASSRFGLVYALPAPKDQTALQKYQTLTTTINSSYDHDTSIPPLENKFRLAYNVALLAAGHLAHDSTHGYINPSNILFLRENENSRQLGHAIRCPYLLQPIKKIVGLSPAGELLQDSIYHHPDADEAGYGSIAAYDIYSVGLVLLELGLWMPIKKFWKAKYDRTLFSERLRRSYSPKLASKCGSRFMKAVQKCLDAPDALKDKSDTIEAAEYLLGVVKDLSHCCALDENGVPSDLDVEILEALIAEQKAHLPPAHIRRKSVSALSPSTDPAATVRTTPPSGPGTRQRPRRRHHLPGADRAAPESAPLKKYPDLPIPQQHLNEWNTLLMPRLSKILSHALKGSDESASVSLMMLGSSPDQAKTTICVQCSDTARVRDMLCKRFKPKRGWGVIIVKGEIRRSGRYRTRKRERDSKTARSGPRRSAGNVAESNATKAEEARTRQQEYQRLPGPGASIGAFKEGEHLPPVSFGGTILVDGEMYGLTVHHMLDDPSDESDSDLEDEVEEDDEQDGDADFEEQLAESIRRSMAPREHSNHWLTTPSNVNSQSSHIDGSMIPTQKACEDDEDELFDEGYDSESDASTIRPDYSIMDEDGNEFWFLDDDTPELDDDNDSYPSLSDDEDETASIGDTPGIQPFTVDDEDLCITQPAIDDVEDDFFPTLEDRDDDHISSHAFGHVHASSGIKRVVNRGMKHEVDWALIRVNESRRRPARPQSRASSKVRPPGSRSSTSSNLKDPSMQEPQLTAISPTESLPNARVTCVARTSGPSHGRISSALSLVKFHGRTSFSSSFTVEGGFGVPGDSGAWIWSEETNELCGHVLAWGNSLHVAFMAPMEVLIEDMKKTLDAEKIQLPAEAIMEKHLMAEEKRKGKRVLEIVEGHLDGRSRQVNKDLSRARDIELALAGLHMEEQTTDLQSSLNQTYFAGQPKIQHIEIKPSQSASSSASSGFARPTGGTNPGERTEGSRSGKDRFDLHVGGAGGSDLQSLPMARALS